MDRYIIYALSTFILISLGQVLFKLSSKDLKVENIHDIIGFILGKYLILALIIYIISTVLWIVTLSKMDLGYSYLLLTPHSAVSVHPVIIFAFLSQQQ